MAQHVETFAGLSIGDPVQFSFTSAITIRGKVVDIIAGTMSATVKVKSDRTGRVYARNSESVSRLADDQL